MLKRLLEAFRAGAAERRFRQLEADARILLDEMTEIAAKDALRRATAARQALRELRREQAAAAAEAAEDAGKTQPSPTDDIHQRRQAIRERLRNGGTVIDRVRSGALRQPVEESEQ